MTIPRELLPDDDYVVISPEGKCPVCGRPYVDKHPAHPERHDFSTFYCHSYPNASGTHCDDVCRGGDGTTQADLGRWAE